MTCYVTTIRATSRWPWPKSKVSFQEPHGRFSFLICIISLMTVCLHFDLNKYDNPFMYVSSCRHNLYWRPGSRNTIMGWIMVNISSMTCLVWCYVVLFNRWEWFWISKMISISKLIIMSSDNCFIGYKGLNLLSISREKYLVNHIRFMVYETEIWYILI